MGAFTGTLRSNEIFASIFNMIISQQVFADNIKGTNSNLVNKARVDGSLYGDTKLYYATDVIGSKAWGNDAEALNLLALHRPKDPECQAIHLDVFRQISLTVDNYLTKQAWSTEGAFSEFNSVMLQWIRDSKRIYDSTTYNVYIGTTETSIGKQELSIDLSSITQTGEEGNRLEAQTIAQYIADLIVELEDINNEYNDYGFTRSYDSSDINIIWNSKFVNKINKIDLPTIFNNNNIMEKFSDKLPPKYFGTINTEAGTTGSSNTTIRSLVEAYYGDNEETHVFAGQLIPSNTAYDANTTYTEDESIICKIYVKLPPFMSAFEVGTSFFNPKSLTENHYLTWGHNTLEYLYNYPFITIRKA